MLKTDFYNRREYLDILEKRVKAIKEGYRQNIAFIGDKDIGKTSIVLHFLKHLNDPLILPVYLEIRPELTYDQFVRKFIGVLLYNFLENSNIARNDNIDFLLSKTNRFIPKTSDAIKAILNSLKKRGRDNTLIQLLSICDIIHAETGKFCVIFFDEFHNLGAIGIKHIYKQFSKMLMIQKNVLYIILSSAKYKSKKILSSNLALLFGNFQRIELEPFNLSTTEQFLKTKLINLDVEKSIINFLNHFTGGCPLYLKIITDCLSRMNSRVTKTGLSEIIQDLLFIDSGILNQRFHNYLVQFDCFKSTQEYQALLYLIADGKNKLKELAINLHKPRRQIIARLNYLIENDIIAKYGDFFMICDRIFSFWLKFVYQEKLRSFSFDAESQKRNFRSKIEDMINQFIEANKKPVLERTMELMHHFEDELVQLHSRRIRLARFREIKPYIFNQSRLNEGLIGRSKDSLWIMAIKFSTLTEEDIIDFAKQCQRFRYAKPQRKIIITCYNIHTNVRLKAMEEKVLTWNLNDLNLILDLYDEPRVIP